MAKTDKAAAPALGADSMHVVHPRAAGLDVHKMQNHRVAAAGRRRAGTR